MKKTVDTFMSSQKLPRFGCFTFVDLYSKVMRNLTHVLSTRWPWYV